VVSLKSPTIDLVDGNQSPFLDALISKEMKIF